MVDYLTQLERDREKYRNPGRPKNSGGISIKNGASWHKIPVKKATASVIKLHDTRFAPPDYCIAESQEGVNFAVSKRFDYSEAEKIEKYRWQNANHRAISKHGYSPLWTSVLNLSNQKSLSENLAISEKFADEIEKRYGLKCIGVAVHMDEGRPDGTINAHAHLVFDRYGHDLANKRMKRLSKKDLSDIQTLASEISGLPRGESAKVTGRKHLSHWNFRKLKDEDRRKNSVDLQIMTSAAKNAIKISESAISYMALKSPDFSPFSRLVENGDRDAGYQGAYLLSREILKNSKLAKQEDYSQLKSARQREDFDGLQNVVKSVLARGVRKIEPQSPSHSLRR